MKHIGLGLLAGLAAMALTAPAEAKWLRAATDSFDLRRREQAQRMRREFDGVILLDRTNLRERDLYPHPSKDIGRKLTA